MALAGALSAVLDAVTGLTNRSLRARVVGLLGTDYTAAQMGYDLHRLRLNGIERVGELPGPASGDHAGYLVDPSD